MHLDLGKILRESSTIAVVGCSDRVERHSHRNARYLQESGFRVIPVNPFHDRILGERCYPTVDDIDDTIVIDIVNVFRRPEFTAEVVADVVTRLKRLGQRPVIWTQIGVSSESARELAEKNGLIYVANRCAMVEHSRL